MTDADDCRAVIAAAVSLLARPVGAPTSIRRTTPLRAIGTCLKCWSSQMTSRRGTLGYVAVAVDARSRSPGPVDVFHALASAWAAAEATKVM